MLGRNGSERSGGMPSPTRRRVHTVDMVCANGSPPEEPADRTEHADPVPSVSAPTPGARLRAFGAQEASAWLASISRAPLPPVPHDAMVEALDAVRDEAVTRHG